MTRPGLIVGLGGTGQWVLTWLKRDLMLSNDGQMPSNVRLLSIDTATKLEAGMSRVSASGQKEEAADVGGVTLDKGEFIYVGGDARPLAERVSKGELSQIGQWYYASKWLSTQAPATFILDDGAGRLRQFGRLAIFKDLLGQETSSKIWRALRNSIEGVRVQCSEQRRLEIMVVGSFAGGTGSGMFIDIALILRMLAQQMNVHHVLRGFFALPSVFTTNPDEEMKARSLAAWRELNRFMVVDKEFPMPTVEYVTSNLSFQIRPDQRLFDACYLVDGKRGGQPLAQEAKYGVFPMVSEAISAILDEEAGTAYTQWIFTNLAPEYARRPETPMYSAVGAFTVQVPAHFVQEISGHVFAQKVLLKLLTPVKEPNPNTGRLEFSGAERHLALAAPDQNQEDFLHSGRTRSRRLLRETLEYGGKFAKPTRFHGRIAEIVESAVEDSKRASWVERLARAGGSDPKSAAAMDSWVSYFPDLGDDPQFEAIRRQVNEFMSYSIIKSYSRREGEKEDETRARFKRIPEDMRTRFGGLTTGSGDEIIDHYGNCGEILALCKHDQLIIFRQMVRLHLEEILNGRDPDPIKARSGKLGYAWDYFDGLVTELEHFIKVMEEVRRRRQEIMPELKLAGLTERARKYLESTAGKKIFWVWEHPNVKGAEQAYLQAQQRMMELRREDILHHYVTETVRSMRDIAISVRDAIQRWIWHLATGDDASSLPGLWDGILTSLEQVKAAHGYDQRIDKVQQLVADKEEQFSDADLAEILRRWEWKIEFTGDPPEISIRVQIQPVDSEEKPELLIYPGLQTTPLSRQEVSLQNQRNLLRLTSKPFAGVVARTTVAQAIKDQFKVDEFVERVADISAEPLFDPVAESSPRKKSNLIRVKCDPHDPYFHGADGLEGKLRLRHNLPVDVRDDNFGIQVVGSENPFKLTLVRTDDLYQVTHFAAWNHCLEAYKKHMSKVGEPLDPVLMHNFSAEARAVEFERSLVEEGTEYQPLHPRVVMLLEDPHALRQFVYLGILGMISESKEHNVYRWQLTWMRRDGPQTIWLTRGWNPDIDATQRDRPTILNAIHGYVIRRQTYQPGRTDRIDKEFAQLLIDQKMKEIGRSGEIKLLRDNMDGGFIGWLKEQAYDPNVSDRVIYREYADLAKVVESMLKRRIEELEKDEAIYGSGDSTLSRRSPFRTLQQMEMVDQGSPERPLADQNDFDENTDTSSTPWQKP